VCLQRKLSDIRQPQLAEIGLFEAFPGSAWPIGQKGKQKISAVIERIAQAAASGLSKIVAESNKSL
jgi:hypothetical protein